MSTPIPPHGNDPGAVQVALGSLSRMAEQASRPEQVAACRYELQVAVTRLAARLGALSRKELRQ